MSLLGLLSVGRAFGTVRRRPPTYQVTEGWLPDFGSRREREVGEIGAHETVLAGSSWPERDLGTLTTASLFEVRSSAPAKPAPSPRVEAPPEPVTRPSEVRPKSEPAPRAVSRARRPGRGRPFQAELAIESVRVVRNDLRSDDLELIPRSPSAEQPAVGLGREEHCRRYARWRGWLAHWIGFFRRGTC